METTGTKTQIDYQGLFDKMSIGLAVHELVVDSAGKPVDVRYLDVNPGYEQILGLKKEQVVGKTAKEIFPGLDPHWVDRYIKLVQTGEAISYEDYLEQKDLYLKVYAFRNAANQFTSVIMDISVAKKTEMALAKRNADLEKLQELTVGRELKMAEMKKRLGEV